jgi:hypothetical protein
VGVLANFPEVNGIIIDSTNIGDADWSLFGNDNLVGYRVEYIRNGKRQEYYRLITGCSYADAVPASSGAGSAETRSYRFNDGNSTLSFITLTPSTSPNYKSNLKPSIGSPSQNIILSNTKFDPVCVKIEVCENDFDTLALSLDGNQIRSLDNGIVSTYNENNELYKQWEFYTLKDNYSKTATYEVKKRRINPIDTSINQDEILNK